MNVEQVLQVWRTTPLGSGRLVRGAKHARCYCAVGALLKACGVPDEELMAVRDCQPYELWNRYGTRLTEVFNLSRTELYDMIDEVDAERDSNQLLKRLKRTVAHRIL